MQLNPQSIDLWARHCFQCLPTQEYKCHHWTWMGVTHPFLLCVTSCYSTPIDKFKPGALFWISQRASLIQLYSVYISWLNFNLHIIWCLVFVYGHHNNLYSTIIYAKQEKCQIEARVILNHNVYFPCHFFAEHFFVSCNTDFEETFW